MTVKKRKDVAKRDFRKKDLLETIATDQVSRWQRDRKQRTPCRKMPQESQEV